VTSSRFEREIIIQDGDDYTEALEFRAGLRRRLEFEYGHHTEDETDDLETQIAVVEAAIEAWEQQPEFSAYTPRQ